MVCLNLLRSLLLAIIAPIIFVNSELLKEV